jgi:dihydropteroate synthase
MGILNVTPDSFSDGGQHFGFQTAVDAARQMVDDGAHVIDVGGESTRPGADPVSEDEETRRVVPVVEALAAAGITVSVDTMKASVARRALGAGAAIVNDVTALSDPEMAQVCADAGCTVCLMHMQGTPRTMQANPHYEDVVEEVRSFLVERAAFAQGHGIAADKIWIDPGIGFGKTVDHNLELLRNIPRLADTGYPVLIGVSRKSFIGRILGGAVPLPVEDRLEGTLAVQGYAQLQGAKIIRAHDVKAAGRTVRMIQALVE